ncbi:MAG TPA: hypothetical protein VIM65_24255 [Cyclobacteriaceae bacterium]
MFRHLLATFFNKVNRKTNVGKDGYWKEFNKQGILISEGEYIKGVRNGLWKLYYETGELVIEETYVNGEMDGSFKSFYKNGQLISQGYYKNSKREGNFTIFDQAGLAVKTMRFKQDMLIEEIELSAKEVAIQ